MHPVSTKAKWRRRENLNDVVQRNFIKLLKKNGTCAKYKSSMYSKVPNKRAGWKKFPKLNKRAGFY